MSESLDLLLRVHETLTVALTRLRWLQKQPRSQPDYARYSKGIAPPQLESTCWLLWLLSESADIHLNDAGTQHVQRLVDDGLTLRLGFPGLDLAVQADWIGWSFCFASSGFWQRNSSWTSVVSSRLGRYGSQLPSWPSILRQLLNEVQRAGELYLHVAETAAGKLIDPWLDHVSAPVVHLHCGAPGQPHPERWLVKILQQASREPDSIRVKGMIPPSRIDRATGHSEVEADSPQGTLAKLEAACSGMWVSPALSEPAMDLARLPMCDRVAICLADRVRVLAVRPGGVIDRLLQLRLNDSRFRARTIVITAMSPSATRDLRGRPGNRPTCGPALMDNWNRRGAQVWSPSIETPPEVSWRCRKDSGGADSNLYQLTSPYYASRFDFGTQLQSLHQQYLVHCVRGGVGPAPGESPRHFLECAWREGRLASPHPMATLIRVLDERRLRSTPRWTRTGENIVSFSSVPLHDLVARRVYQSHLGRWDWEPYGFLIRRDAIERLGGRPVVYGDENQYESLELTQRTFFQLAERRKPRGKLMHWKEECEWRLVGDLEFSRLPRSAICIFVPTRQQADQLARRAEWSTIWLGEMDFPRGPAG